MDCIPKTLIRIAQAFCLAIALAGAAQAQTAPDMVLGTAGSTYSLFTPTEVVNAGGGNIPPPPQIVPTPPATGKFIAEANDQSVAWISLSQALEAQLYAEIPGGQVAGNILVVRQVDTTAERTTLWALPASNIVNSGVPTLTGNSGRCLRVNNAADAIEWGTCGGIGYYVGTPQHVSTTAGSHGTSNTISRGDHRHQFVVPFSNVVPPKSAGSGNAGGNQTIAHGNHQHPAPDIEREIPAPQTADVNKYLFLENDPATDPTPFAYKAPREVSGFGSSVPNAGDGAFLYLENDAGTKGYSWVDDHEAILAGLPAITGHSGNALFVNATADGVEWKSTGGGGGGGGGSTVSISSTQVNFSAGTRGSGYIEIPYPDGITYALIQQTLIAVYVDIRVSGGDIERLHIFPSTFGSTAEYWQLNNEGNTVRLGAWIETGLNKIRFTAPNLSGTSSTVSVARANFYFVEGGGGGGGGGDTNPSIPKPSVAGALQHLRVDAAGGAYELADPPKASNADPQDIGSKTAGTNPDYSRADHIHGLTAAIFSDADPLANGTAAPGTHNNAARGDHVHPSTSELPALTSQGGHVLTVKSDESGTQWSERVSPFVLQQVEQNIFRSTATNQTLLTWGGGESHPLYVRSGLTRVMPYDLGALTNNSPVVIMINDNNARYELYTTKSQIQNLAVAPPDDTAFDKEQIQFNPVNTQRPTASWRVGNAGNNRLWIASPSTYTEQNVNIHTNLPVVARYGTYSNTPANLTRAAGVWDNTAGTGMMSTADATLLRQWIRSGFISQLWVNVEITRGTGNSEHLALSGCPLQVGFNVPQPDTGSRHYHCEAVITGLTTYQVQVIVPEAGNSSGHINLRLQGFNSAGDASVAFTFEARH